jgi:hypothetical protein
MHCSDSCSVPDHVSCTTGTGQQTRGRPQRNGHGKGGKAGRLVPFYNESLPSQRKQSIQAPAESSILGAPLDEASSRRFTDWDAIGIRLLLARFASHRLTTQGTIYNV